EARARYRVELEIGQVVRVADREPVEMRELGGDAPEIVPHAEKDLLDLGRRFFRKRRHEVVTADAVLAQPRADGAREAREHVADPEGVAAGTRLEEEGDERAGDGVNRRFRQPAEAPGETSP